MMGGCKNVFVKSATILIVLVILAVNGYENDDLVFDQDGQNSAIEVPLVQKQGEPSAFQRVKRAVWDWFIRAKPETVTTERPEADNVTTDSWKDNIQESATEFTISSTNKSKSRKVRDSGEENTVDHDNTSPKKAAKHDNDIGDFSAGRYSLPDYRQTDDEDLSGSGDVEGSATDDPATEMPRSSGSARFYRVTLTVSEPYREAYADRTSTEYVALSRSLSKGIKDLYRRYMPDYEHFANVIKISPLDSDPFTSQVTLDVGSTFGDELDPRNILEEQLQYHSLGGTQVSPDGFTFRNFQASGKPECDEHTEMKCRDGACIPLSFRCDNTSQCADFSDELGCPQYEPPYHPGCAEGEFACDVSRCILDVQRCDFHEDCDDGSDEATCVYPTCVQSEFKCRNGQCIDGSLRCNGISECRDGSDETNCPCKANQFECTPLYCISSDLRCDGFNDCSNGRDERDCESNPQCRGNEFECNDGSCVSQRSRCDGRRDCPDDSDERNCTVTTCNRDQFRCQDGTCLAIDKRCDGNLDCRNGEDEIQCGCGPSEFICNDGQCVPYKMQCNGVNDCRDGSDERDCASARWRNYYNAEKFDRRLGKVTTGRSGKQKVSRRPGARGRPGRIGGGYRKKGESRNRQNVGSTRFEIPSAGNIGDPIIAAYPEFASLIPKIEDAKSGEDSPNKEWEVYDEKTGNREKIGKIKNNPRNIQEELDRVFAESNKIDNPIAEAYPEIAYAYNSEGENLYDAYDEDFEDKSQEFEGESEEDEGNSEEDDEYDDDSYDEEEITTSRIATPTGRKDNNKTANGASSRRPPTHGYRHENDPETTDRRSIGFPDSSFADKANTSQELSGPSDELLKHSTRPSVATSEKSTDQQSSTKPTVFKNRAHSVKTATVTSSVKTNETAAIPAITNSKLDFYNTKYKPWKTTPGTVTPADDLENAVELSSNLTKIDEGSKVGEKSYRYKDSRESNDSDIVNVILKRISSSTVNTSIDSTTPTKPSKLKIVNAYLEKYRPTKASTLDTTNTEKYVEVSSNTTMIGNASKGDEKLYRHGKDLRGSADGDAVNEILKSMNSSTTNNSALHESTIIDNVTTNIPTATTVIKFASVRFYIHKYNVTKITRLETSTRASYAADTAVPPQVSDPNKEVEIFKNSTIFDNGSKSDEKPYRYSKNSQPHPDDVVNKILRSISSSTVDRSTIPESTTIVAARKIDEKKSDRKNHSNDKKGGVGKNRGRNNGKRKSWRHKKGPKPPKKPDPYGDIKVESELFQSDDNEVNLPKHSQFDFLTENTTIKTSHGDDDDEKCNVVCEKCWKKKQVELINVTVSTSIGRDSFKNKSDPHIDSGFIESHEDVTRSAWEVDLKPDDSQHSESREELLTTKKSHGRKKNKTATKIMVSTTQRMKSEKGRPTGDDRKRGKGNGKGGKGKKPRNKEDRNRKNGNGKKGKKTTNGTSTTTEVPNEIPVQTNTINEQWETTTETRESSESPAESSPGDSSSVAEVSFTESITTEDSMSPESEPAAIDANATESSGTSVDFETGYFSQEPPSTVEPERSTNEATPSAATDTEPEKPATTVSTSLTACGCLRCWDVDSSENKETSTRSTNDDSKDITTASAEWKPTVLSAVTIDNEPESSEFSRSDERKTEIENGSASSDGNVEGEIGSKVNEVTPKVITQTSTTASGWVTWKWSSDSKEAESSGVIVTESTTGRYDSSSTTSEFGFTTNKWPRCRSGQHICDRNRCIDRANVCDRIFHCHDGSDERYCLWQDKKYYQFDRCRDDQHACDRTVCLEIENVCDGFVHCRDESDETNCHDYMKWKQQVIDKYRGRIRAKPSTTTTGPTYSHTRLPQPGRRPRCHPEFQFRCYDGSCIYSSQKCDGIRDCVNGEDEDRRYCRETPYCPDGETPCANGACIPVTFFCDGISDCQDRSDEKDCPDTGPGPFPTGCGKQFTCRDGSCAPQDAQCDGRADCPDNSDEDNCKVDCSRDQFQCRNGDCISGAHQCDRVINCDDGSDEEGCEPETTPANRYCTSEQFTCISDRTCVHYSSRCNGIPDCRDRSDEEGCDTSGNREGLNLKTYPSEQIIKESREVVFQCRDEGQQRAKVRWVRGNGLPLPPGSRDINGRLEIPNIQLEHAGTYICEAVGYPSSTPGQQLSVHLEVEKFEHPATRPSQVCKYDEATCSNGDCIPKSYVCDGKFDCTDGSDEMRCSPHGCEPNQYRCANKQCVSKVWRCDGDKDCADGSDEENCATMPPGSPCRYDEYKCANVDQCIPKSYQCDMERDCQDGSDEFGCSPVYITKPPPAMMTLHPGESMILTCTAIGVPIPEINWRLNWGHVPSKCYSTSVEGLGTLTCPDIQISDQGAYSCEALNVAGFVFAVPDTILVVNQTDDVCPVGKFNSEARTPDECIPCFCFGVTHKCRSANLFTYQLRPPFDRHRVVTVSTSPTVRIQGELSSQVAEIRPRGSDGVDVSAPHNSEFATTYNVPYFELPNTYYGKSQLRSYGGYLRYSVSYSGDGSPNNAPDVILIGNNYLLIHRGEPVQPDVRTERLVRFFEGEWLKNDTGGEIPATREEIMMALAKVDNILIRAKYENSPQLQVSITNIVMDTADATNTGLGAASFVEECSCPTGYSGESCQNCAPGFLRRERTGPWLGECYSDAPVKCHPGYYGDPTRNIPCKPCPCPLTNPSNQFGRTCNLGSDLNPICHCPPGYVGLRCEKCAIGYHGNPLIPGDMCVRDEPCDPRGSITPNPDFDGKCRCKQYATGLKCDKCKANTFNLASKNQFGCISCFCMGITDSCISSNWFRNEIRVSFTNSIRNFTLVDSNIPNAQPIAEGIRLDTISREIVYSAFPNRGNTDVYYWQLPNIFRGNQIASYGGNLRYTVRYVPSPGGQSSRNNAADVELISANDINLLYYSRETPESNSPQSFAVPLLEQYWQRNDGTKADREHLLMALADVKEIRIKATYTTHTNEAALSLVSLDTSEKYNTGKERAVEVEECSCPAGYRGLSCEDCAVGYTRAIEGLYLGICEPCNCNGHSSQCDPETGICENCSNHTTGENCDVCEPGYEGDATRGGCARQTDVPRPCHCDPAGSESDRCVGDRCVCKANVEGSECNRCRPSTFGLSADNTNGCNECYCSGVTKQCHESSLYIQQIPIWVYDSRHGFTLTDPSRLDVIDDGFDLNVALNEIGYRYSNDRNRRLFWSLPATFTGNKVKSYGGKLTLTQHITAFPNSQTLRDQDVLLVGNGIRLFWLNPEEILPGIPLTYSVPLRESEWRRLSTAGPRRASRTDLMTVLSNLEAILVRASHSEGMTATYISDISLDTAVENGGGSRRATQIEACRCPQGYSGTSCETCARGYYRDINDRSVSILGSCNVCPCNEHEESCEITRSGQAKCHCLEGYTGQYCQDVVDYPPVPPPPPATNIPPPRIIVSIRENNFQIVHTGSTVKYHCSGRSLDDSPLRIRWEKEGSPMPEKSLDDTRGLLVLRDVRVSDSGIYVCHVSDGYNVVLEKVTLTVGGSTPVEPKAQIHPLSQRVMEGEPVQFRCEGSGNPQPDVDWVRVSGPMNPEATFRNGIWRIEAVTKDDAAEYKCIARNELGVHEQTTILYVLDNPNRPSPNSRPDGRGPSVTPPLWVGSSGDTVRLICARSDYDASVFWVRSGALPLPQSGSQRNGVLTIGNPIPSDSGIYICTSTSHEGSETSTFANVTIYPKRTQPTVRVEPERQTVSQGTSAEVRCIGDRDSGLQIKWIKYGEQSIGPNARQVGDVLKIVNPQVSDRGVYICRASNAAGSYEASAIIEVEPRETPILELHPKNSQIVTLGGSADIQCRVLAGFPVPDVYWKREDGRPFAPNVQQLAGGLLRLTNVTVDDGGTYRCLASNPVGSTSAIARIEVQSLPVITVTPTGGLIYVKQGARVRLTCSAQGLPQPTVTWMKSQPGLSIYTFSRTPDASRLTAVHEIMSMSLDDEGSYTCQAINAAGITEERVQIRIEEDNSVGYPEPCRGDGPCDGDNRPHPDDDRPAHTGGTAGGRVPADDMRITPGGRAEIRCRILGPPDSQIYVDWKRSDRRPLPEGSVIHGHTLTINGVTKEAAGEYVCIGLDPAGVEIFRAKHNLQVVSPPRIELNPNRQTVGPGENPAIVCTATGDQPLRIEWEAIGRPLPYSVSNNRGVLQFHGITSEDAGKYVCKATNDAGTAEAVAEVLVSENPFDDWEIHAPERDVITFIGNSVRLTCNSRQRSSTIDWSKEGRALPRNVIVGDDYIEIMRVRLEDGGKYICQTRSNHGVSSDYVNLRIEGAVNSAVTIEPSQDVVNIGDMIDLRCTYTGAQSPRYRWTRPNHPSLPANALEHGNTLRISNIELSESGVYRCHADTPEGTYDEDYNLIVQGGTNDAPAIETKYVPYGSSLEMGCRMDLEPPIKFHWSKLGGLLPRDTQTFDNKLKLIKVKADDAGTYICTATNGIESSEVPTVLVVTGVVPYFNQAPQSWISLPPLSEAYLKFNIEVSFKPEIYDGLILYNDDKTDKDFISLSLVGGYPEFKFDLGSGDAVIRADKPVTLGEWHTIKLQRNRKEGTMLVDGEGPYKAVNPGRKQGLDLREPLYIGGVSDFNGINPKAGVNTGFVGCISRLVLGEKVVDLIGDQTDSVGVTTCETCAENPCNNAGVCQEASTKSGYKCLCRAGYSGRHCDSTGQACYPDACGDGTCVDNETGFECYCRTGRSGPRCEFWTANITDPAFRDDRAFLAYPTPTAVRRTDKRNAIKVKRSHARSSHVLQLRTGRPRNAYPKRRNVHNTKH